MTDQLQYHVTQSVSWHWPTFKMLISNSARKVLTHADLQCLVLGCIYRILKGKQCIFPDLFVLGQNTNEFAVSMKATLGERLIKIGNLF